MKTNHIEIFSHQSKMYLYRIFYVLAYFLVFRKIYGNSVNSGCYSGDLGMDVFCEETGCSNLSDGGENYEPSIMKYQSNSEQVMMNFVCKQNINTNEGVASVYNVVYSDEQNEFMVPITHNKEYWYSPLFEVSESGNLIISFNNLNLLDGDDTITIVKEDNSVYCEIYFQNTINNLVINYNAEPNQKYKVRVGLNFTNTVHYPECQNDLKKHKTTTSEKFEIIHERSHFKRVPQHHLLIFQIGILIRKIDGLK